MSEIIEGEVVEETTALATVSDAAPATLHGTTDPVALIALATAQANELKKVIKDRGLIAHIRDREHVTVEGWTTLGAMLGVFPVVVWSKLIAGTVQPVWEMKREEGPDGKPRGRAKRVMATPGHGGWEARVEARTLAGQVVGAAESECRWDETTWRSRDTFALRSMAQTRATSKALRLPLGWVMALAGFDPSPEEEMPGGGTQQASFDLHKCPGDRDPGIWTQQVAAFLYGDKRKEDAANTWGLALDQEDIEHPKEGDDFGLTVEQAEAVVARIHDMKADDDDQETGGGYG